MKSFAALGSVVSFGSVLAASIAALSFGCSSSDAAPPGTPSAGAAGSVTSAGAAGASPQGGAPSAGASTGGAPSAGAPSGGASSTAGAAGAAGGGAVAGAAGSAGAGTGGAPSNTCPANATFCSGFEDTALPTGAVYKANAAPGDWSRDFAVDTTLFHSGKSALRVKSDAEGGVSGAYRMLAVPTPTTAFWVRFYMQQTDLDIGGNDHNVFAGAAASDETSAAMIEFAEDVGVAFNTSDSVKWPPTYGRTTSGGLNPFTLPKGMWHCIEISFDAQGREQKLFINNTQQIDATDYPAAGAVASVKNFKFGFNQLHGPSRKVWYDDVVVAPTRIPCF
ncbi:MAG: hypothetical protein ABW061_24385 [Polyangiaceae bacterium]